MSVLLAIIISTFLISAISLVGIVLLSLRDNLLRKLLLFLVAFSAGGLLGGAFFHLLPEAITKVEPDNVLPVFVYLIAGFCTFFVLEQFISWHHHHEKDHEEMSSFSYLILISDAIHNFIDGLTIAAAYLIAFPLGITATLVIVFHEIPQEIGDFGVLIYSGFARAKAIFLNFVSGASAILGGLVGFLMLEKIGESMVFLLPFAAGNFIYIASSDLVPEIKSERGKAKSFLHFLVFLAGIGLMWALTFFE